MRLLSFLILCSLFIFIIACPPVNWKKKSPTKKTPIVKKDDDTKIQPKTDEDDTAKLDGGDDTSTTTTNLDDMGNDNDDFAQDSINIDDAVKDDTQDNIFDGDDTLIDDSDNILTSTTAARFIDPYPAAKHLLISEITVTPNGGEFIEIYNPTNLTITLDQYYLSNANNSEGSNYYYYDQSNAHKSTGSLSGAKFNVRFPSNTKIFPSQYKVISLHTVDDFYAKYGKMPDYEIPYDITKNDGSVPNMQGLWDITLSSNQGFLPDWGGIVVLYHWDGITDKIDDIDYVLWGNEDHAVSKTGIKIDGPDLGVVEESYYDDTLASLQIPVRAFTHAGGLSFQRIWYSEGEETKTVGNGITISTITGENEEPTIENHDETSENLKITWIDSLKPTPGENFETPVSL